MRLLRRRRRPDPTIRPLVHATIRVGVLADCCTRYGAVIDGLGHAVAEALTRVDDDELKRELEQAIATAEAQLGAINDAINAATRDLPEADEVRAVREDR